jgi:hypothetical protein
MKLYLFVGERPSPKALQMGVTWADGRLAAKQLFDALMDSGIDPAEQLFDNVFRPDPLGPEEVCRNALRRISRAAAGGVVVVAMGQKVSRVLANRGLDCLSIVHPAARGRIRKKTRYAEHVRSVLGAS